MDNVVWNKCQTPFDKLSVTVDEKTIKFNDTPQEVQEQFWDFINNVPLDLMYQNYPEMSKVGLL